MEKIRFKPIPRSKKERIGLPTGLLDCHRDEIYTGDIVRMKSNSYQGPVLWNRHCSSYGIFLSHSLWYGNKDPCDPDCYGKFVAIPADNGMRMELEPVVI